MKIQKYKHDFDYSYALGATLSFELVKKAPELVQIVFISSDLELTDSIKEFLTLCSNKGIHVETNDKAFNILSPKGNCYIISMFSKRHGIIKSGSHIVLVNPSDSGNMGTIIRTAVGFGLNQIAIIRPAVDIYDPKTVRASMGALFHANIQYFKNIEEYINLFPNNNMYAFMLDAAVPIRKQKVSEPFSLIFGNEATGLPHQYADFCMSTVIPHSKNIDSLNLPIAASIAIYEFTKKNWED